MVRTDCNIMTKRVRSSTWYFRRTFESSDLCKVCKEMCCKDFSNQRILGRRCDGRTKCLWSGDVFGKRPSVGYHDGEERRLSERNEWVSGSLSEKFPIYSCRPRSHFFLVDHSVSKVVVSLRCVSNI